MTIEGSGIRRGNITDNFVVLVLVYIHFLASLILKIQPWSEGNVVGEIGLKGV